MAALDVDTFKVDERSPVDLIAFAAAFSRLLTYRSETGETGSWETFFTGDLKRLIPGDISFLIAEIASVDAGREYLETVGLGGHVPDDLLPAIHSALKRLDRWYQCLSLARSGKSEKSVEQSLWLLLTALIKGNYASGTSNLPELVAYLGHDPALRQRWASITASGGDLDDPIWTPETADIELPFIKHDPIHIYGLVNRTTRVMAEQTARFLPASLRQPDHAPHAALLLTFVELYSRVQADLNKMTGRHLNFYYRTILQLTERASKPDKAHVYLELSPQAAPFILPRGTRLSAGVDAASVPIFFALDEDMSLDHAQVARIASLYVARGLGDDTITGILARPVANSQDGFGAPLLDPDAGWSAFGVDDVPSPASVPDAEIGIVVRSALLLLRAGARKLTVTLLFASGSALQQSVSAYLSTVRRELEGDMARSSRDEDLLPAAFRLSLEGTDNDRVVDAALDLSNVANGELIFILAFAQDAPPIAAAAKGSIKLPALRIAINPTSGGRVSAYSFFEGLALTGVCLDVSVAGLAPLMLQTAAGLVDGSKPFLPFGPLAPNGAYLIFWHPDLCGKALEKLTLNFQWSGLPASEAALETLYAPYGASLKRDSFRASLSVLSNYAWTPTAALDPTAVDAQSFPLFDAGADGLFQAGTRQFQLCGVYGEPGQTASIYSQSYKSGFFKLQLVEPIIGFGQQAYPELLTSTMLANTHALPWKRRTPPSPPINPMLATFSVDYTASANLAVQTSLAGKNPDSDEGVYRYGPFKLRTAVADSCAFPILPESGYLLIGIAGLSASGCVTLLFHVKPSAADFYVTARRQADEARNASAMKLRYFSAGSWKTVPPNCMTQDTTEGLTRSGLIGLQLPVDLTPFPAALAGDLCWLQLSVSHPELYGRIIDLRCQGATATRVTPLGPANRSPVLPANTIAALAQKTPKVIRVVQPFATEGGLPAEDERRFQIRVSERLRHKQRAILPRDYELLILDRFPSIGDAKCLTRGEAACFGAKAGEVVIVVAPLRLDRQDLTPLVPEYLLREIGAYLLEKAPPSVKAITIRNPEYERIRVSARLDFTAGDRSEFLRRVYESVDDLIAPWAKDPMAPLPMGSGGCDVAGLRAVLEDLNFVQNVDGLSLVQFYSDPAPDYPNKSQTVFARVCDTARSGFEQRTLAPWWPWSVLVPASDHQFKLVGAPVGIDVFSVATDFVVAAADGDFYQAPQRAGIGNMEVGLDLPIQAGIDHMTVQEDFLVG